MKRLLFIVHRSSLIVLLFALPAFAEFSGLPDGVKANLPAIKKYHKASSILLWVKDAYTQSENGEQVYERHEFRYLADDVARDTWGDPHIAYVEGRQKLDVITARTYTSDGRMIDATPNAFNSVTPDELDHALDFSDFHQMVVTLLGLENGSITELHYGLTTEKPLYPWLWGRVYFREEVPTIARELSVQLPGGQPLNFKGDNGAPEPLITGSTYIWRMGEQRGYLADDLRGHRVLLPNVAFTTAGEGWPGISQELNRRYVAASDSIDLPISLQRMLADATNAENVLDSIKFWLRERFNRTEFDHPDFQITFRPMSQVLISGYGNSLEMAALAANVCKTRGIVAWPVVWFAFEPLVPSLYDATGGLLQAKYDWSVTLSDPLLPRSEFTQSDVSDASYLVVEQGAASGSELTNMRLRGSGSASYDVTLRLNDLTADTLRGQGFLEAYGLQTPYEALRTDPKAHLEHLISWSGFAVEGVTVKRLDPANAALTFAFTLPRPDTVDSYHALSATAIDLSQFAGNPNFNLEHREFPHYVKLPGEISVHLEASLPDGWSVTQQPAALTRTWKDGSGFRTVNVKDGRLVMDETLTLGSAWIPPQDWSEFRSFLIETGDRPNNIVVFSNKSN